MPESEKLSRGRRQPEHHDHELLGRHSDARDARIARVI
jgi:hypothetical protein